MIWGSEEWKAERDVKLRYWLKNNEDAFNLLMEWSDIGELWDDFIDRDKPISVERVHNAFMAAVVEIPNNSFFQEHRLTLTPILIQAISSWMDANEFEHGTVSQRALAYTLRNIDIQLVQCVVYIIGGFDWLRQNSRDIWNLFGAEQDGALDWIAGA
jgi:hypothetical protein